MELISVFKDFFHSFDMVGFISYPLIILFVLAFSLLGNALLVNGLYLKLLDESTQRFILDWREIGPSLASPGGRVISRLTVSHRTYSQCSEVIQHEIFHFLNFSLDHLSIDCGNPIS